MTIRDKITCLYGYLAVFSVKRVAYSKPKIKRNEIAYFIHVREINNIIDKMGAIYLHL